MLQKYVTSFIRNLEENERRHKKQLKYWQENKEKTGVMSDISFEVQTTLTFDTKLFATEKMREEI